MSEPIHSEDEFFDLGSPPASHLSPPQVEVESTTEHLPGSTPPATVTDNLPTTEAPSSVLVSGPAVLSAATTTTAPKASTGTPSSTTGDDESTPLKSGSSHHLRGRKLAGDPEKLLEGSPLSQPPPPPPPPLISYDFVPIYALSELSTIGGFEKLVTDIHTTVLIRSSHSTITVFLPDIAEGTQNPDNFMTLITTPCEGLWISAIPHTVESPQPTTTAYLDRARILFQRTGELDRLNAEYCVIFSAVGRSPRGQTSVGRQRRSFGTRGEAISEIARALYSGWDIKFVYASVCCDLEKSQEHFRARMENEAASNGWIPVWYQTDMSPVSRCLFY